MPRLRTALIGVGRHAPKDYVPAFSELAEEVELVAACDVDPASQSRLTRALAEHGTSSSPRFFTEYESALDWAWPDLAIMATHHTHLEIARELLLRKIPFLKDKPFAMAPADTEELARLIAKSGYMRLCPQRRRHLLEGCSNAHGARCRGRLRYVRCGRCVVPEDLQNHCRGRGRGAVHRPARRLRPRSARVLQQSGRPGNGSGRAAVTVRPHRAGTESPRLPAGNPFSRPADRRTRAGDRVEARLPPADHRVPGAHRRRPGDHRVDCGPHVGALRPAIRCRHGAGAGRAGPACPGLTTPRASRTWTCASRPRRCTCSISSIAHCPR
ncbi:putative dehydrogenase [Saccharomonospora marina XMU15]|uniref:Putative dehydrogenase n=1 Tax=Saccharomonospora marina XMU15 TaxID=882083 RepID=H5X7S7_9PSEU|nr:putative dehydrogenase [Saccharomonospora marina XMU15]